MLEMIKVLSRTAWYQRLDQLTVSSLFSSEPGSSENERH